MKAAILVTPHRCTACRGCQIQCKNWNQLEAEKTVNLGTYENPPDLTFNTYNRIRFQENKLSGGGVEWWFFSQRCFHCENAACVIVCPVGAITYGELGNVVIDQEKCIGCKYCVENCPFGIPRYSPLYNKSSKCHLCFDRITNGLQPACTHTCPADALRFGDLDELTALGKERVEKLKADGYKEANLYGEKELGGLRVMYVLAYSPDFFGLPTSPSIPASVTIWEALKPIGLVAGGLTIVGLAASYLANIGYQREHQSSEGGD
jgi:formate dehydrogenase iron-sulfur subunit